MNWINIKEKLPPLDEKVLFVRDNEVDCGWFENHFDRYNSTHWMPLPKPPEGKMSGECDKCGEHAVDCTCVKFLILPPEGKEFKKCPVCSNPFVYDGISEICLWCELTWTPPKGAC